MSCRLRCSGCLPLALYLATFIGAFSAGGFGSARRWGTVAPVAALARPGAVARRGALSDPADRAGAPRGVHRAGVALPRAPRREPAGPRAPDPLLRVHLARRRAGRRGGGPDRAGRVLLDSRVPARDRARDAAASAERRCGPPAGIAGRTLGVARRARRRCSSPATGRVGVRRHRAHDALMSSAPMVWLQSFTGGDEPRSTWFGRRSPSRPRCCCSRQRTALLFAGTAGGTAPWRGRRQNGRRCAAPRTHVLRCAPGHVPSERRLARADARHDDAWRAGISRQAPASCPPPTTIPSGPIGDVVFTLAPEGRLRDVAVVGPGRRRARRIRRQRRPHGLLRSRRRRHPHCRRIPLLHLSGRREGPARAPRCGRSRSTDGLGCAPCRRPRTISSSSMPSRRTRSLRTSSPARPWRCTSRASKRAA